MLSQVPLLVAAATVGMLHMSAPDHWATLVILGRLSKWNRSKLMGVATMTAIGHAAFSVLLGFGIVGLGVIFSHQISLYLTEAVGVAMVGGGLLYALLKLRTGGAVDYQRETQSELAKGESNFGRRFGYFAVLGAALSPDLSILPIFLLAVSFGLGFAIDTAVVFGLASIAALLIFLLLGMAGLARVFERIPPKYNDALVGFVVATVGAYILLFG